jgi:hypothetical protein
MPLFNVTVREDRTWEVQIEAPSREAALQEAITRTATLEPHTVSVDNENCDVEAAP